MLEKTGVFITGMIVAFALAGCSIGDKPSEEIYSHLEEAAILEQKFEKQQQPLVEAEKKEQQLYNEIISLSMKEYDKIVSLSKDAIELAEKRQERIKKEKESVDKAYQEFTEIKPIIEDMDKSDLKKKAQQLSDLIDNRYKTYGELYDSYQKGIAMDIELYKMLQNKELKPERLQQQIDKVNKGYKIINEKKEAFNKYTEQYNAAKKEFYKAAGLEIGEKGK